MNNDTSAVTQAIRQLEIAREALEEARSLAAADVDRDDDLIAQLEQTVVDLESTIAALRAKRPDAAA